MYWTIARTVTAARYTWMISVSRYARRRPRRRPSAQTSKRRTGITVRMAAPKLRTPTMFCRATQFASFLQASCTSSTSGLAWSITSETTDSGPTSQVPVSCVSRGPKAKTPTTVPTRKRVSRRLEELKDPPLLWRTTDCAAHPATIPITAPARACNVWATPTNRANIRAAASNHVRRRRRHSESSAAVENPRAAAAPP
ncbi:hypothetical protein ABIA52_002731 [Paenarthrobacter histidinolovorans]|uniref:Uncharacterized protein n=1 Tax=Paenarthrobacter histidinolovorans TaxID=43664 RepID=A0ABW8N8C0_9MICC